MEAKAKQCFKEKIIWRNRNVTRLLVVYLLTTNRMTIILPLPIKIAVSILHRLPCVPIGVVGFPSLLVSPYAAYRVRYWSIYRESCCPIISPVSRRHGDLDGRMGYIHSYYNGVSLSQVLFSWFMSSFILICVFFLELFCFICLRVERSLPQSGRWYIIPHMSTKATITVWSWTWTHSNCIERPLGHSTVIARYPLGPAVSHFSAGPLWRRTVVFARSACLQLFRLSWF